jgi:hypothetical protein
MHCALMRKREGKEARAGGRRRSKRWPAAHLAAMQGRGGDQLEVEGELTCGAQAAVGEGRKEGDCHMGPGWQRLETKEKEKGEREKGKMGRRREAGWAGGP